MIGSTGQGTSGRSDGLKRFATVGRMSSIHGPEERGQTWWIHKVETVKLMAVIVVSLLARCRATRDL
jgi:hypothetical protein